MIQTDYYGTRSDGTVLVRTWSDAGKMLRQIETGLLYAEAVDVEGRYSYAETRIPAPEKVAEEVLEESEEGFSEEER